MHLILPRMLKIIVKMVKQKIIKANLRRNWPSKLSRRLPSQSMKIFKRQRIISRMSFCLGWMFELTMSSWRSSNGVRREVPVALKSRPITRLKKRKKLLKKEKPKRTNPISKVTNRTTLIFTQICLKSELSSSYRSNRNYQLMKD